MSLNSLLRFCCAALASTFVGCGASSSPTDNGAKPKQEVRFASRTEQVSAANPEVDSAPKTLKPAAKSRVAEDIFSEPKVLRIEIEIPRSGISALRNSGWGNGQSRPKTKATIREGTLVYTNVAVHLKGAAGSFRPIDQNPCLTLNFDKFAPGQSFHGLDKISLNNSVQDPSYLSEKICRELFEAAGVPVPRATHAKVQLNGRDLGLYVLTEGYDKQFLKRFYKNAKGNLYDGGFVQEIDQHLAVNSGDQPENNSGLKALISAAREQNPSARWSRLEQVVDMDRFLAFVAMEVMQCHWDGYTLNRNNWRLFHDLDSNKMVFFPHGLDQMFGVMRSHPDAPILPGMNGLVARAVVGTSEGRRRYIEKVGQLYTNVFHVDAILKRIDEVAAVIRPALAESQPHAASYHRGEINSLKQRIRQRAESIQRQLATLANPTPVEIGRAHKLTGWRPRILSGQLNFSEQRESSGTSLLYIRAQNGSVNGSWRTRLFLEPGNYRFEGKIRTKNVTAQENGAGAGLRISQGPLRQELTGTAEWRPFAYSFAVAEGGSEVEFICELRATRGEAWFDASSLNVVRLR